MARVGFAGMLVGNRVDAALIALFALSTSMMLSSMRVFVSYLVFVVDQSQRTTIALVALSVFAFPALAGLLSSKLGNRSVLAGSVFLLLAGRLTLQFIEEPTVRVAAGGATILAWGVLAVLLLATARREAGIGLVLGFALDVAIRTATGQLDLPWSPNALRHAISVLMAVLAGGFWFVARETIGGIKVGSTWKIAASLISVGPALALHHLLIGNPAFVMTHTGMSAAAAGALLATGIVLGIAISVLRLLAIGAGGAGGMLISRFIIFDAIVGAVSLSFAWSGDGLAPLGVLFATVTATELVIFALVVDERVDVGSISPVAIVFTLGMVLHFVALFLYYTATGSGAMLALVWAGLVAGAFVATGSLLASLGERRLRFGPSAVPALAVLLLLIAAPLVARAVSESPNFAPGDAGNLRIITYNIQSGFSRDNHWDLEAIAEVIEDADADIVLLQEVSRGWLVTTGNDQLIWLSNRLDMPFAWGAASRDDLWGNAVLSRFPIVSEEVVKYSSTQNLRRSALIVEIDTGRDSTIDVIATHLDNPSGASGPRSEQVDQLIGIIDPNRPTIVGGDFNMTPDDPLIERVLATGLEDGGLAAGADQVTSENGRRIDYILVSGEFEVVDGSVIDSDASDHRPVVLTLVIP